MEVYVKDEESLLQNIKQIRLAQKKFSTYTQEQVDKIFKAVAIVANEHRIELAKMAYEETGMGVMEDKVIKNHFASEYIYNAYKNRNISTASQIAQQITDAIKRGELVADDVEGMINKIKK